MIYVFLLIEAICVLITGKLIFNLPDELIPRMTREDMDTYIIMGTAEFFAFLVSVAAFCITLSKL